MRFVRHATTPGMRAARFPADEDADPAGLAKAAALGFAAACPVWTAPGRAARQTAQAMGLPAREAAALREADVGRWRGLAYDQVAPEALASWLTDPDAAPHGGESLTAHAGRVATWLDSIRDEPDQIAICDAGTIRAALGHALGTGPLGTARFDLAPLSVTGLTVTRSGWRIAYVNRRL
ncbi:histidine phosphatase family protein [Spongiactinospora rosea]|uniref:Histidine phosphatase family protein n=1 Tax=Spongiactinospora rosea TaxID=2248750 RepID=A0A366LWI8_9ACTN|nr:histidine phosphatase family protein [Spongiactinospora rosea]RBQ18316.1 histidine phosphatase family protein [Spongiactinospora rosea]